MSLGSMGERTEGIRKQAQELIEQAYQRGYKTGREEGRKDGYEDWKNSVFNDVTIDTKSFIEQGRDEAWEAARKLVSMGYKECNEVLGDDVLTVETIDEIFVRCTASEAINKIKAYEEQKKQEEDEEINVGDEVILHDGDKAVVTEHHFDRVCVVRHDGCISFKFKDDMIKTGRTFPQIAEVLKKMGGDENG